MIGTKIWQHWRNFFFEPQSVLPLAVYRILFGILVLQTALVHIGSSYADWYGTHNVISIETIAKYFWHGNPRFDLLLLLPKDDVWINAYFISYIVAAFFLTIGFATRFSAIWVCLGFISLHNHMPFNINGGDAFLRLESIFLAFSPCGYALSIDNVIRRRRGIAIEKLHSPWAQRMIQLQLALAYGTTAYWKFTGWQWQDGTAVYYATRLDDMIKMQIPFLLDNLAVIKLLTWYTLFIEAAGCLLIWFRCVRYYVIAGILLLHLGIDMFINLPIFEWAFMATLVTFIYPEDLERLKQFGERFAARNVFVKIGTVAKQVDVA